MSKTWVSNSATSIICFAADATVCKATEIDLNDMPYAGGAKFNSKKECLPGTRTSIINDISDWVNSSDGPRICLLSGVAGSGKSSIANTVAHRFKDLGRLGSSFCFDRSHAADRRPDNLFSTIARDLADLDHQRKSALWDVIQEERSLRTTHDPAEQFEKFILLPTANLMAIGPILIVIDALDESGDKIARKALLSILGQEVSRLPPNFRILVTSRAEADIQETFDNHPHAICMHMGAIDPKSTDHDISVFVLSQLSEVKGLDQSQHAEWCHRLVEKAEGLFQWASTVCLFIATDFNPTGRLEAVLSLGPQSDKEAFLDDLYQTILKELFKSQSKTTIGLLKQNLGMVLAVKDPLSLPSLEGLRCIIGSSGHGPSMDILRPLGSLLTGVTGNLVPVRPLHSSFRDFLISEDSSKEFFIDTSLRDESLALACLQTINMHLMEGTPGTGYLFHQECGIRNQSTL